MQNLFLHRAVFRGLFHGREAPFPHRLSAPQHFFIGHHYNKHLFLLSLQNAGYTVMV